MIHIENDSDFKQALATLTLEQQREVGARFVENVLALSTDQRLVRAVKVAADPDATEEERDSVWKAAKAVAMETYTRCGADGNWTAQGEYFIARAATATCAPKSQVKTGGPAWQAAMSSRMARTCESIESDATVESENARQYQILNDYLSEISAS